MITDTRCYLEVNPNAIRRNGLQLKHYIGDTKLMSVLKADAYGMGISASAKALSGITDWFAVATAEEALTIRDAGIDEPILVLGYVPLSLLPEILARNVTIAAISEAYLEQLDTAITGSRRLQVHLAVDTGLSRIGLFSRTGSVLEYVDQAKRIFAMSHIHITGIFTHFAVAGSDCPADETFTNAQYNLFKRLCKELAALDCPVGIRHCCNSNATIHNHEMYEDMVRCGKFLYGFGQNDDLDMLGCSLAFALRARVVRVATDGPGSNVGYGRVYTTSGATKIATISFGFADGYRREMGPDLDVLIRGKRARIVGRIAMDFMMADVTGIEGVRAGDYATLIGRDGDQIIMPNEVSARIGASTPELVCSLHKRVPKFYLSR